MKERIKVFLNNGFTYKGTKLKAEEGFIRIQDEKDGKLRSFPLQNVSTIEELGTVNE